MRILWLTWKDMGHPLAGGAEVVNEELAKRLVKDGHKVTFVTGGFKGGKPKTRRDGFDIIRLGNRYTLYYKTWRYYRKHLTGQYDLVIDEVNTMPFFARFYVKEPVVLFVHMLCRQIWFYQLPLPLSLIGFWLEPLYLRLIRGRPVITVSNSTKKDLMRYGFKPKDIHIISEGISIQPVKKLNVVKKYPNPTLLTFGAIRPMKRTMDILKAFELAKAKIPNLRLKVAGDNAGRYGRKFLRAVSKSPYANDIEYEGTATTAKKIELMQKAHLLIVTSVKEGWGLVVTEAASQGTPAIVYNTDGLRDSVQNNKTGCVVSNRNINAIAAKITAVLGQTKQYEHLRQNAWQWSEEITFSASYDQFKKIMEI